MFSLKMTSVVVPTVPSRRDFGRQTAQRHKHSVKVQAVAAPTESKPKGSLFVDYDKAFAASTFPIPPEKLIERTKELLAAGVGPQMQEALADDYQFVGPVVGPLNRESFLSAIKNIDFKAGFPDLTENYFGFHVDPIETNRVWFMGRGKGTHTGKFIMAEPSGKTYEGPPEVISFTFNEKAQIVKQTVGVCADRTQGNTGGLGGAYGMLYAIGSPLPFPEAQPWKRSWQYSLFSFLGGLARR